MKRLLILSGKGGTGKTTTAAAFLRFAGAKAAADCDVDAPNLHLVAEQTAVPEVSDFLGGKKAVVDGEKCIGCGVCLVHCRFGALSLEAGRCRVNEYVCEGCGVCVRLCPQQAVALAEDTAGRKELYRTADRVFSTASLKMGRGNSGKLVTDVKMAMLKHAPPSAELAVIDGSPGIGCPVIASVSGVDLVLVVAEPSLSGRSDLERLVQTAGTLGARLAVCVNKWDVSPAGAAAIRAFCEERDLPFLGMIPYDPHASEAINAGRSLADTDCLARDALKEIFDQTMKILELNVNEKEN